MNFFSHLLWLLTGSSLAVIYLKSQNWSVDQIDPEKPGYSTWLIIGGAIIRWICISLVFIFALSYSFTALLCVFVTFMIVRLVILLKKQRLIFVKKIIRRV